MNKVYILDSTLRDGAQGEGVSFSVQDKLTIVKALDDLGVDYIEAGNPGSNPKDIEFFQKLGDLKLKHSKLVAFGATRRKGIKAEDDVNLQSMLRANTPAVTFFGKSSTFHVTEVLNTTLEENLCMIEDTARFLKNSGKEVIYDAEHFFDGYKLNPEYAIKTLKYAVKGGAEQVCLCDTNGGCYSDEIAEIIKVVSENVDVPVGIHTHDDCGVAVSNSIIAVKAGATHVQGTLIGFGERCGNANLAIICGGLKAKLGYDINIDVKQLTPICRKVAEVANVRLSKTTPFVGKSAFAHKAGMHIDGINKNSKSFEHIAPEEVGNSRRFLMSEIAGRGLVQKRINALGFNFDKGDEVIVKIADKIKEMEFKGYQFEGADASFELLIQKELGKYVPFFSLISYKTIGEGITDKEYVQATAIVNVEVGGREEITASEGDGPVSALDRALRKALEVFYPNLKELKLSDYKVRILDSSTGTSAVTRVLVENTDGKDVWTTVGVSKDIIEASLLACIDGIEYKLFKDKNK